MGTAAAALVFEAGVLEVGGSSVPGVGVVSWTVELGAVVSETAGIDVVAEPEVVVVSTVVVVDGVIGLEVVVCVVDGGVELVVCAVDCSVESVVVVVTSEQ